MDGSYCRPENIPAGEDLPVPPPFMFICDTCWKLLALLARKAASDAGCLNEQVHLAKHIATAHPDEVPRPHDMCIHCTKYDDLPYVQKKWAQHRARDLFLPEVIPWLLWPRG